MSTQDDDTAGKRLAVLRQAIPTLRRVAVLFDANYPSTIKESDNARAAAHALDLEVIPLDIRQAQDVAPAFAKLCNKADALYIVVDSLVNANRTGILTFAAAARLPSIASAREYVQAGALLSYGGIKPIYIDALPISWIRFYMAQGRATFPSSNR
jgi:putative tryptophan/tyrosine transport system substrate-binding protein